jgi:hypothetical protein
MNDLIITRTRVVLDRGKLIALLNRNAKERELILRMRDRLMEEHRLLQLALHQLALAQGNKDPSHFARRWLSAQRKIVDPVPVKRGDARKS